MKKGQDNGTIMRGRFLSFLSPKLRNILVIMMEKKYQKKK